MRSRNDIVGLKMFLRTTQSYRSNQSFLFQG